MIRQSLFSMFFDGNVLWDAENIDWRSWFLSQSYISRNFFKYLPVYDFFCFIISSGGPSATI